MTGTAEDLTEEGFYWYETNPWVRAEVKCSVCYVSNLGVEFIGEEKVFNKWDIHGKFWKIERPIH